MQAGAKAERKPSVSALHLAPPTLTRSLAPARRLSDHHPPCPDLPPPMTETQPFTFEGPDGALLPALLDLRADARAGLVLAHGAGAGMEHAFMAAMALGLSASGVAVLRFQFPFMAQGSRRPDPPAIAQGAVRAAVAEAKRRLPAGLPLFAGGKSFGGRMTSQAQADTPLDNVRGLVFFGFPLHAAGKPDTKRAKHLAAVQLPMLFLQGTRDELAEIGLVRDVTVPLVERATLHVVEGADHSFHVLKRSGRNDADVLKELVDTAVGWMVARQSPAQVAVASSSAVRAPHPG